MKKEYLSSFIRERGLFTVGLVGLGAVVGVLIAGQTGGSDSPFFNERILLSPPSSVYAARDISTDDHVWGNPRASVVVVEYSDLECPYCKPHFYAMRGLVNEYRDKIAWVYRHHPLDHLHPKGRKEAEAAECAADLGGPSYFWRYVDSVYQVTPSNNGLDLSLLPELAADLGLPREPFESCLSSGKFEERVSEDIADAKKAGLFVTPSLIIYYGEGERSLIIGSQSGETMRRVINYLLAR